MNRYNYHDEKQVLEDELRLFLQKCGDDVLEVYLSSGFDALAVGLQLSNDLQRQILFDYIMLQRQGLLECIRRNKRFFVKMIADGKGPSIRPMLGISQSKYDALWREALDLLSLYFVEKKVIEKMTNFELDKFFTESIFGKDQDTNQFENGGFKQ